MADHKLRQSDRISITLPIRVTGRGALGGSFTCEGQTELVSRQGAKIVLKQALAPDQQIQILCLETGKEAAARVVGRLDGKARLSSYGIALVDPESNPWGIDFPERGYSAAAVGRIVLECQPATRVS